MKNKVYYRAQTQYENYGDLIINKKLLDRVRLYGDLVVDTTGLPKQYLIGLNLKDSEVYSGHSFFLSMIYNSLFKNNVYFITKPGHAEFKDSTRMIINRTFNLIAYMLMKVCNVKICRIGGSLGLHGRYIKMVERLSAKLFYRYIVRDSGSYDIAYKNGHKGLIKSTDLAFLIENKRSYINKNVISISLRSGVKESAVKSLIKVLESCCFDIKPVVQVDRDIEFMNNYFNNDMTSYLSDSPEASKAINSVYSESKYVISNRLHVLIVGMANGNIPIAFVNTNNNKIIDLFKDLGLESHIIYSDQDNLEENIKNSLRLKSDFIDDVFSKERNKIINDIEGVFS